MAKRKHNIYSLTNLLQYRDTFNLKKLSPLIVEALAREGEKIIQKAYANKNWMNRTYNLFNSYVSGVFVGGKFVQGSDRYLTAKDSPMQPDTSISTVRKVNGAYIDNGRQEAIKFLQSYSQTHPAPNDRDSIKLVVAAAMFYSGILESKGYTVISVINAELERLTTRNIKVSLNSVISGGDKDYVLNVPFEQNIYFRTENSQGKSAFKL